jgi:hypothetical protein
MGQNQQPQGQMVSGRYVPRSFFEMLQPAANMIAGAYIGKQSDTEAAKLAEKIRLGKATAEESIINKMTGTPAVATEMAGPYTSKVPMPVGVQPAVAPNLAGALREIRTNQYGAGKEYTPTILKQMMPEPTSEMQNFNYGEQNPAFVNRQNELKLLGRNVNNINMPAVESAYNKVFGEKVATQDANLKDIAETAQMTVSNIARQKKILEGGNFFSGKAANIQNDLANYGTALGVVGKDGQEKAVNTQSLISGGAGITLDNIKGSGLGAGQGFTDKDLQFLQDAKSFKITFNKENIARALDLQEKAAIEGAKKWNSRQGQIQKSATVPINVGQIEVPTPYNGQVKYLGPESK